ncbi:MAG: diguanylate cyclase (GGDEF) domain-containing protein [Solidesulfovibrio magneticus str. Maddingley MBC34]|uniref:diguanylate cyclase n=1 Tax=Solidesulfovibrio magneticus str. Maddingley MBC34 TaxID=1206767 RepID=K6GRN0_9BACT|nr:MAG: diguanylate cyclase (GGDEF) domain-containing protein [Solidesulfovibrio magneticus str. Maddingley MBC34]
MALGGFTVISLIVFSILYISHYFIKDLQTAQDTLTEMALTDAMTGLYNRLTGIGMLKKEISRVSRNGNPLSLAIIDIDLFKKINDTYGHSVGDEVLITFARMLQNNIRKCDTACRYGGEEFLIIMPDTALKNAFMSVTRLLDMIHDAPAKTEKEDVTFTFSAGVAEVVVGEEVDDIINRADMLLYKAKSQGRNQVCMA